MASHRYLFRIDSIFQASLDTAVERVLKDFDRENGCRVVSGDAEHVDIKADLDANKVYSNLALQMGFELFSEHEKRQLPASRYILVTDPIDGSGGLGRCGPCNSSVSTAAMIMEKQTGRILAISVGNMNTGEMYGFDEQGVYTYNVTEIRPERKMLAYHEAKKDLVLAKANFAAYARQWDRLRFLMAPMERGELGDFTNNGGHLQALWCVQNPQPKSYAMLMELKPAPLYEHIGSLLASNVPGTFLSRLDGSQIVVDTQVEQTGIFAVTERLAREAIAKVAPEIRKYNALF